MPPLSHSSPPKSAMMLIRPTRWIWVAALILSVLFLSVDSWLRLQRVERVSHAPNFIPRESQPDLASPSGYRASMHQVVLFNGALDSFHWILQTEQMFATKEGRVRHVNYDNAPDGREVHWASLYRWWIGVLAKVLQVTTGRPLPECITIAALYSNPLLLLIALLVTTPWLARKAGSLSAAIFALGITGVLPLFDSFNASAPDHHGLACLCGFFTLLFLLLPNCPPSLTREESARPPTTKRYFIFSGIAGGLGLWVSAASQLIVLVAIGLGAALTLIFSREKPERKNPWFSWSAAGAITSLICYGIEYLPSDAGWRLEVNHPVYALAWLGAGWLLQTLAPRPKNEPDKTATIPKIPLILSLLALALPLATLMALGGSCFLVSDPFLWKLHKGYIDEFQPLSQLFAQGVNIVSVCTVLSFGTLIVPLLLARKHAALPVPRAWLSLAFGPGILITLLAFQQIRWLGLGAALLIAGLIWTAAHRQTKPFSIATKAVTLLVLLVLFCGQPLRTCWALGENQALSKVDIVSLQTRDLAQWLRFRSGGKDVVVASSPTLTTPLIYFGGLRGLGTFYWENIGGLKVCADLFSAPSFEDAQRIVAQHGVTHIVLVSWDSFVSEYASLRNSREPVAETFAARLIKSRSMPPWLRLVPYQFPGVDKFDPGEVLVFEVVPDQTPETRLVNLAHYFLDVSAPQTAARLLPDLERHSESLKAKIVRARIYLAQDNRDAFSRLLPQIMADLPGADRLSAEESLHLAALCTVGGQESAAKNILSACIDHLDTETARMLSPGAAYALLALARVYDLSIPEPTALIAEKLLAPRQHEQLFPPSPR